jgi:lysophospholipase L1-like esterase
MTEEEYFTRRRAEIDAERSYKLRMYSERNKVAIKGKTVCAGSSLMELFPIEEFVMNSGSGKLVYNRGMSGFTIAEYDKVLDICVLDLAPSKLFINIGSNDLNLAGDTIGNLITGYRNLLLRIKEALPECDITLIAYYPCCKPKADVPVPPGRIARTMENVNLANEQVKKLAAELNCAFINLNSPLLNKEGFLREELALDSIHFSADGYADIFPMLEPLL